MPTGSELCTAENAHITSLNQQLTDYAGTTAQLPLAIVSTNPTLDSTAVARLKHAGMLLLRVSAEALSKSLEDEHIVDAVDWAVLEGHVSSLTLVGHSQSASIPLDAISQPANPVELARMHNERVEASKLKLKDDLARFLSHPKIHAHLDEGRLSLHALLFLQESSTFLRFDAQNDGFRPLI